MPAIDKYFRQLIELGGSDLHLSQGQPPKVRVHGSIKPIADEVLDAEAMETMMTEICDPKAWQKYIDKGDLDFAYEMDADNRFRCNYLKQQHGLACVFRIIPTKIASLEQLNIPPIVKEFGHLRSGLVLVTGPTGSGKTTTLYALLNSVNDEGVNIQTIEDPIEYEIEGINQTQTNNHRGLDFANGLRALLRADPDIILIGESRDAETAGAAVNASLTGHLVLTTLHANDSLRAVTRLLAMGVEKYLLADSLALSQAQRLSRRLCSYCKTPVGVSQELQEILAKQQVITSPVTTPIFEARGCDECHGTGYAGRVALMELCEMNSELRDLIEEAAPMSAMRAAAFKNGFRSLYQEGLAQVLNGATSLEEIKCLSYTAM